MAHLRPPFLLSHRLGASSLTVSFFPSFFSPLVSLLHCYYHSLSLPLSFSHSLALSPSPHQPPSCHPSLCHLHHCGISPSLCLSFTSVSLSLSVHSLTTAGAFLCRGLQSLFSKSTTTAVVSHSLSLYIPCFSSLRS